MILYNKEDKILANIARAFEKRMKVKADVELKIDPSLGEYCGKICNGVISAGSHSQLLDTAGRYLRNPKTEGTFQSYKEFCGMYFTTHHQNYLDAAPLEELYEYMDDLAFWGMNVLHVWFDLHHFDSMEDEYAKVVSGRLLGLLKHAKSMGIKTYMAGPANEAFNNSPEELRADWTRGHDGYIHTLNSHYHLELCPNKEGAIEKLIEYKRQVLEVFKEADLDYWGFGPYDEGGCTCPKCRPWGSNGYLKTVEALIPVTKEYMPDVQFILGLWQFDHFTTDNESAGVQQALAEGRLPEIKYVNPQHGSYGYSHDMHRPRLSFPEISMTDTAPWGAYGTNVLPGRFQKLWEEHRDLEDGGDPYLEGIYADLNAVIMLRCYRDNQSAVDTVKEYLAYEFGLEGEMNEKVCKAICDMEETLFRDLYSQAHRYVIHNPEKVFDIEKTIVEAHETLPEEIREGVKWQMIYLRAVIDGELKRNDYYRTETTREYFKKIVKLCHLEKTDACTLPDIYDEPHPWPGIPE
ncbi:MAG: hypothetical protein E7293_10180 [Lachnospiraceae bacterium]|nr:hypothetical protein [Lachnospiraceae bacterium]